MADFQPIAICLCWNMAVISHLWHPNASHQRRAQMHNNGRSYTLASLRSHDAGSKESWRPTCLFFRYDPFFIGMMTDFVGIWIEWLFDVADSRCLFWKLLFLCFGISFCRLFLSSVLSVTLKRMWLESLWVLFFSSRFFIVFVPASCCLFRDTLVVKNYFFIICLFFLLRDCVHGVVIFYASFFIVVL